MTYTHFEACTVQVGGQPKRGAKATCGHCKNSEELQINTHRSHGNDDDVVERLVDKKFESIGWLIAKTASQHRCPSCFSAIKASRKRKNELMKSSSKETIAEVSNKIVQMPTLNIPPKEPEQATPQQPEAPKRPTRDEKRIIFQKIDEVYVGEKTGYSAGWNDKRIANDLGVPVIWVSNIRDDNFGPDIDEAMVMLVNEAKAVVIEMKAASLTAEPILTLLKELSARSDRIEHQLKGLTKE